MTTWLPSYFRDVRATIIFATSAKNARLKISKGLGLLRTEKIWSLVKDHHDLVRVSAKLPFPQRRYKGLVRYTGAYLVRDLTLAQKREIIRHHLTVMNDKFSSEALNLIIGGLQLWSTERFALILRVEMSAVEGELSLHFCMDGDVLQTLSFTFCPGPCFGNEDNGTAILVGLIQGKKGAGSLMDEATRMCANVRPAFSLLAALEGIADFVRASEIIGVSNKRTFATGSERQGLPLFNYDSFWEARKGCGDSDGLYRVPLTQCLQGAVTSASHRRRARKRRAFRTVIRAEVLERLISANQQR